MLDIYRKSILFDDVKECNYEYILG